MREKIVAIVFAFMAAGPLGFAFSQEEPIERPVPPMKRMKEEPKLPPEAKKLVNLRMRLGEINEDMEGLAKRMDRARNEEEMEGLQEKMEALERKKVETIREIGKLEEMLSRALDRMMEKAEEEEREGREESAERIRRDAEALERVLRPERPGPPPGEEMLEKARERIDKLFKLAEKADALGLPEEAERIRRKAEALEERLRRETELMEDLERLRERPRELPPPELEKMARKLRELERAREEAMRHGHVEKAREILREMDEIKAQIEKMQPRPKHPPVEVLEKEIEGLKKAIEELKEQIERLKKSYI